MITYKKSVEFRGDLDAAMSMAKNIFATNGFEINQSGPTELSVTGPGMSSTKQDPIKGLSHGELKFTATTLEFAGELGGVESMKKFLYLFPLILGLGLAVLFVSLTYFTKQSILFGFIPLLAVFPWLFISPILSKSIQKQTERAVETALGNISKA